MKTTLTRLFTVALLMMISIAAGAQVKVLYGKDGEAMKADEKGTIVIPQKEQKEPLEGGTITITQEKPTDGKVRVNFTVAPASGYTYTDGNITLVAFYPLSSTRADSPAGDITVHSTLTLTPKDKSQTDTSKPRDYYVDIDEGLGLWVQKATFGKENTSKSAVATPEISFSQASCQVSITCATDGASIYYRTDGSDPDPSAVDGDNPTKTYSGAFTINGTTTVKAIAKVNESNSDVQTSAIEFNYALITDKNGYLKNNVSYQNTFNAACIWTHTSDGYLKSGNNYIKGNESTITTTTDEAQATVWVSEIDAENSLYTYFKTTDDKYIKEDKALSTGASNLFIAYRTIDKNIVVVLPGEYVIACEYFYDNDTDLGTGLLLTDPGTGKGKRIDGTSNTAEAKARWNVTMDDDGFYSFQNVGTNRYITLADNNKDTQPLTGEETLNGNTYRMRINCYRCATTKKRHLGISGYNTDFSGMGITPRSNDPNNITLNNWQSGIHGNGNTGYWWYFFPFETTTHIVSPVISGSGQITATGDYTYDSSASYYKSVNNTNIKSVDHPIYTDTENTGISFLWSTTSLPSGSTMSSPNTNSSITLTVASMPDPYSTFDLSCKFTIDDAETTISKTIVYLGAAPVEEISHLSQIDKIYGNYKLNADISGETIPVGFENFHGILDGNFHSISGLSAPLFETLTDAIVRNLVFKNVNITSGDSDGDAGTICNKADGSSCIYNCGILPTGTTRDEDGNITGFSGSSVSGTRYVGGLVGLLDGTARVINCYSYATVSDGADCGGIVGYNNVASTSSNLNTMVMNCMFYGKIEGTNISPIYGGRIITNNYTDDTNTGLNNYNYFRYNSKRTGNIVYNCALGAEDRFLNRFEFYRLTLNSTRDLAAYYVSADAGDKDKMAKWVLDKSIAPYPILKEPGIFYPSVINPDAKNAVAIDADNQHRNEGRKLGTLTVKITSVGSGAQFAAPAGAAIKDNISPLTLNVTDKDFDNYNFNYKKIQLPYYSEVGTGNYTKASATDASGRVVTGWKITEIKGGTPGTFTNTGSDVTFDKDGNITKMPFNFVDRQCTNKDLYSVSGRVFNQGAYWEVPDGVYEITIEPYWAKAAYLSDPTYDITYEVDKLDEKEVDIAGDRPDKLAPNDQPINTSFADALTELAAADVDATHTVYDYAVVLVGNYHKCFDSTSPTGANLKPVTIMSADFDGDCEPDYTFFYQHTERQIVAPIRFDFINIPGVGMMQKATGSTYNPQPGVFHPKHWFEITNTVLIQFNQFEYADQNASRSAYVPTILQGGVYEQFVSARKNQALYIQYMHVGGNAWFKNFAPGCHTGSASNYQNTPKVPISVSGGDYENFYLSGIYCPQWTGNTDNAECYIDGGRFKEVAGAGMQIIGKKGSTGGNVTWCINAADIDEFYGGGINDANPVQGDIYTKISNSYVRQFCGGPKFGNMVTNKTITTVATNCHFGDFYGAGYGGTSLYRLGCEDNTLKNANPETRWNTWAGTGGHYSRTFEASHTSKVTAIGTVDVNGISVDYSYEYTPFSGGSNHMGSGDAAFKVSRFFVDFATVSFATAHKTTSTLNGCYIKKGWLDSKENASKGNVFGGGNRGSVEGDVSTTITNCDIEGDVYGAGNKADAPTVDVRPTTGFVVQPSYDNDANIFNHQQVDYPESVTYTWSYDASLFTNNNYFVDNGNIHLIYINQDFSKLGLVEGNATLTINGNTTVKGDVYGGGAEASVTKNTEVIINGGTIGTTSSSGNVFGGGDKGVVGGNTIVTLSGNTNITGNVFGGGNEAPVSGSATVNIVEE